MSEHSLVTTRDLILQYQKVRQVSELLAEPFSEADQTVQSMPDASPVKWHLAHTTWFFETFLLKQQVSAYQAFNEHYEFLFNSYYNSVGAQFSRPNRGLITRPGKQEVLDYRRHVDEAFVAWLEQSDSVLPEEVSALVILGLNHEQQHQELLVTDIQHALSFNPLLPSVLNPVAKYSAPASIRWQAFEGGLVTVGYQGNTFCFDNETPSHQVYLYPYQLASRLITNEEYLQFIESGGYSDPLLWLSEGWHWKAAQQITAPLYWRNVDDVWQQYSLAGLQPLDPNAPVRHISYFEANAFATWYGARLPTEFEWEHAAHNEQIAEHFHPSCLQPVEERARNARLTQLYNQLWQWTQSQYLPYPGFGVVDGAVGEYNGKFMSNQFVLRGGSCATPAGHARASYRNFFPATTRWQFTGIRIAKDDRA